MRAAGNFARRRRGCAAVAWAFAIFATVANGAGPVARHEAADFLLSDSPLPPPATSGWQPAPLPDDWEVSRPGVHGFGWYRVRLSLAESPEHPYAVLVSALRTTGSVYVNGTYVGRSGPLDSPERALRPQLVAIPPSLLREGANDLYLRLHAMPRWPGVLSAIRFGDESELRREYERQLLWRVTGPQMVGVFSLALGLGMLALGRQRRSEPEYGWFGTAALAFAAFVGSFFVRTAPGVDVVVSVLAETGLALSIVALILFALRYAGWRRHRSEAILWAYLAATPFLVYLGEVGDGTWIADNWRSASQLATSVPALLLVAGAFRRKTARDAMVAASASAVAFTSLVEPLFRLPSDLPPWSPYAWLVMELVVGGVLVASFVRSLNASERLNIELAASVARKRAELALNHQRVHEMERRQAAVLEERNRIMRDMHDGIGAQLVSTLSLVQHGGLSTGEVADALRDCLDDLRLTIDSLEPAGDDLAPVLGNLRHRLEGRLRRSGLALEWNVADVPPIAGLSPQNVLHVLRILQEAITNVLKHANARTIRVESAVDESARRVLIRVEDDGVGFRPGHAGRGLANMRRRAQLIGATIEIVPSPRGTLVRLALPID